MRMMLNQKNRLPKSASFSNSLRVYTFCSISMLQSVKDISHEQY